MDEHEQRARVVAIAREWIGTPYRDGGRLKGIGADCTFTAMVYEEAGLTPHIEIEHYSPQAHLHRTGGRYVEEVEKIAHRTDDPRPGDMVLYWFGRDFSHGGIIVDPGWPHIIHGDKDARFVIEAAGDQGTLVLAKERRFYTLW